MIYETEKYVNILIQLKITPNQFLLCWMLYNKQWKLIEKYMQEYGAFKWEEIKDLIDKSLILNLAKEGSKVTTRDLVVTEIFADEMIIDAEDAWDEFMRMYPGKVRVNDAIFASKGLTISDEKAVKEKYQKIVNNNKYEHNNILALVEKWKNKNGGFATMKIDKFVIAEFWKEIETERDNYVGPSLF